jgi:sulfatase maturation enzyme AslB (radical SAM superfamily)
MRNYRGSDFNGGYPITELRLADIQKIFQPWLIQQLKTQDPLFPRAAVDFNGNLGDFAMARDAKEIVQFFVGHDVRVEINTNGSLRQPEWWAALADSLVEIGFALDGLADTHEIYRQDTDWHRIMANARAFIQAGGRAIWRFIPFDHNRHQEQACRDLAAQLGFFKFENIYDGRDTGPVFDKKGQYVRYLGHNVTPHITPDIQPLLQSHLTWFDPKIYKTSKDTETLNLFCTHKRNREIYLAADGTVYPCCYLGFYPKTMHHPGNCQTRDMVQENNALEHDLEHCMAWFDRVEESWSRPSVAQGRLYQCVNNCNRA